jgi:hypothetical protein
VGVTQTQVIGDSLFITLSNGLLLNAGHVRGLQGVPGSQGPIGLTGPQGIPGNDGATGPQGPIGLTGPQGVPGNDGATGPQGPIGFAGLQGPQGVQGATGNIGPVGPQGIPGTNGIGVTQTNVIGDSLFITLSNGQVLNAGHVRGTQGTIGGLQPGSQPGQLLYWNGTAWVSVPPGNRGQSLIFCDSMPTWGGCLPQVTTSAITNIMGNVASTGGVVTSDGGSMVSARGVAYGTTVNPTLSDSLTNNGTGSGPFSSLLTGLSIATTYYVRAYATNGVGTSYGNELSFTTDSTSNCIFNPGTPNPWSFPSAPSGGYIPLGNFGAQSRFSISMWVRPESNSGIRIIIDANHGGSSNWVIQTVNSGATWCWGNLCFSLQPSVWQHLLLTYDNGLRNCFINGILSHSLNNPINYSGSPSLFLGNWPEGARRFNGYIDELYITRDVLATSNFIPEQYITNPSSNTFRLFHFDEGMSTGTVDAITNVVYPLNNWIWSTRP